MIKLTQGQFDKIIELEKQEFVEKVEKEILAEYANLIPCNSPLSKRLKGAYDYLLALNFQEKILSNLIYIWWPLIPTFRMLHQSRMYLNLPVRIQNNSLKISFVLQKIG
ncbi:hypothetical protein [Photorhabdus heterorhabditis]|uniref:hypothetical protein n=1 Tax=Photorhabdus heterorhabditis TaxID=880156 RepID=UPI0020B8B6C3|nr:hypothetical protein [Photorhabdus heterorhabditis]